MTDIPSDHQIWPPRVQVAGVSSIEEALFCSRVGVDAVGFTLELPDGVHDGLTRDKARQIIAELPGNIVPVVITYVQSADDASRLLTDVGAQVIQFHGGIAREEIARFREVCPGIRTIGQVTVFGEQAIADASLFEPPLWDAIIIDSFDSTTGRKGATGLPHDWTVSARIAETSRVPVILAGGLNPDNVAQAIATVHPDGVDVHTGVEDSDGARNFAKIRAFAQAALGALAINQRPRSADAPSKRYHKKLR